VLKTLAAKHYSTVSKMADRYKAKIETPHGLRTCFEAVRRRNPLARKEIITRLLQPTGTSPRGLPNCHKRLDLPEIIPPR
jgi:hypothetical protein